MNAKALNLFEKHKGFANKLARKFIKRYPSFDPDEIKQGSLLGLWIAARDYIPSLGSKFTTFAYKQIHGHCLRAAFDATFIGQYWMRRRAAGKIKAVRHHFDLSPGTMFRFDGIKEIDDKDEADSLLNSLSSLNRQIVRLHLEGYEHTEIAEKLGISWSQSMNRYHRSIQKMKKEAKRGRTSSILC